MRMDLNRLTPGKQGEPVSMPFEGEVDLSAVIHFGERPFPGPVKVRGEVSVQHGEWSVRYTAQYRQVMGCARCLTPVERDRELEKRHPLVLENPDDASDAYIPAPGGILDIDALAGADLTLELPGVVLCGEACKGLCPQCGANRNERECGCGPQDKPTDPRFEALRELLEQHPDK